jgi:hypothetical protein
MWTLAVDRIAQPYERHDGMLAGARLRLGALVTEPDSDAIQLPFLGLALDQKLLIETGSLRDQDT